MQLSSGLKRTSLACDDCGDLLLSRTTLIECACGASQVFCDKCGGTDRAFACHEAHKKACVLEVKQ